MAHIINAKNSAMLGATINGRGFDIVGAACSLINSLIASENGCGRPINPTLFGPFRRWK